MRIIGIKRASEKHIKMINVYKACVEAEIDVPEEVKCYFNSEPPNVFGVEVKLLDNHTMGVGVDAKSFNFEKNNYIEIQLGLLDPDIDLLRIII